MLLLSEQHSSKLKSVRFVFPVTSISTPNYKLGNNRSRRKEKINFSTLPKDFTISQWTNYSRVKQVKSGYKFMKRFISNEIQK